MASWKEIVKKQLLVRKVSESLFFLCIQSRHRWLSLVLRQMPFLQIAERWIILSLRQLVFLIYFWSAEYTSHIMIKELDIDKATVVD
jgi:hypothetical protein